MQVRGPKNPSVRPGSCRACAWKDESTQWSKRHASLLALACFFKSALCDETGARESSGANQRRLSMGVWQGNLLWCSMQLYAQMQIEESFTFGAGPCPCPPWFDAKGREPTPRHHITPYRRCLAWSSSLRLQLATY
jgi:hypothetical protein